MAYSLPLVAPNIFILKLKLHCKRCENKLKRLLLDVEGIQTVNIDPKQGTVTVSGPVDPATIVTLLGNLGRKAEILWEQRPSADHKDHNLQIIAQSKVVDHHPQFNDPDLVAQLQQLSGIKGLKSVEVSYSKTIRLTLKGDQNDLDEKNIEITIRDGVLHGPQICHSGGICTASASCCGGHGAINRNLHGCCGIHAMGHPNWTTNGCGFVPTGLPPPWPGYSPSAPPLGLVYDQPPVSSGSPPPPPPPAMGYSYSSFLSDDNTAGGCNIM